MREIEKLCELPGGPAVLVAHHVKKGDRSERGKSVEPDQDDIRGASGIVNRVRWAAILEKAGDRDAMRFLRLTVVKGNYAPLREGLLYVQPDVLPGRPHVSARGAIRATIGEEKPIPKKEAADNQQPPATTRRQPADKAKDKGPL
jgi:hypothetical protein